jgi:LuxR family maltose regulon positive regulatory protein
MEKHQEFLHMAFMLMFFYKHGNFSDDFSQFILSPPLKENSGLSFTLQLPFMHRSCHDFYKYSHEYPTNDFSETLRIAMGEKARFVLDSIYAGFCYERNLHDESLSAAKSMIEHINDTTHMELIFSAAIHLIEAYRMIGDTENYELSLQTLERDIRIKNTYCILPNLKAYKARVAFLDNNAEAASEWLEQYFITDSKHLYLYKIYQYFATIRAHIILSEFDEALNYAEKLVVLAEDFDRLLDIAEAKMLQSVVKWFQGYKKEAQTMMEEALYSMQGFGFIRLFADEGSTVVPILTRIINPNVKRRADLPLDMSFVRKTLIAAHEQSKRYIGMQCKGNTEKTIKLPRQQKKVVSLLAEGYNNAAIAEVTGLSIHTVKRHLSLAYEKLGVNNAIDAVEKSRELGLI